VKEFPDVQGGENDVGNEAKRGHHG
jgi:hypothetical protein